MNCFEIGKFCQWPQARNQLKKKCVDAQMNTKVTRLIAPPSEIARLKIQVLQRARGFCENLKQMDLLEERS